MSASMLEMDVLVKIDRHCPVRGAVLYIGRSCEPFQSHRTNKSKHKISMASQYFILHVHAILASLEEREKFRR